MSVVLTFEDYEKLKKFQVDLKKCLNKVLDNFPEFSHAEFCTIINLLEDTIFAATYSVHPTGVITKCTTYCGNGGLRTLYDDDRKEGAWAHEFCEALHLAKKSREAFHRFERWYGDNKRGFRLLVEKHADMDAARRGYGHKLVEALRSIKQAVQTEEEIIGIESRIKNLENYLRK
ncbi:hypothetical protein FJZ53_02410 [Candidatus Woesearchaeota archaeon]|nr:hypothetical protein [Candidatus Woesearchaeota archaeon]